MIFIYLARAVPFKMVTLYLSVPSHAASGHTLDAFFWEQPLGSDPLRKESQPLFVIETRFAKLCHLPNSPAWLLNDLGHINPTPPPPPKKEFTFNWSSAHRNVHSECKKQGVWG